MWILITSSGSPASCWFTCRQAARGRGRRETVVAGPSVGNGAGVYDLPAQQTAAPPAFSAEAAGRLLPQYPHHAGHMDRRQENPHQAGQVADMFIGCTDPRG
jgi:hypothetical protein